MRGKVRDAKRGSWRARRARVQRRIGRSGRVRLTVFRSAKHMYAQLVDGRGKTLASVSTRTPSLGLTSTGNIEAATKVGEAVAALARERNIDRVVFNRNGFLYHGRVKALADAAREAGLQF